MNMNSAQVGIDRIIRLGWLDKTARFVLAGNDKDAINDMLQALLEGHLSGGKPGVRGSREKTITVLMKTWLTVPERLKALRDDGLKLLQTLPEKNRIAVQWGMMMASYPFWGVVAEHTGRLLRLQGTAAASHIQRRVREQCGERQTVSRSAQRTLRSFVDWGVLSETRQKGIYASGDSFKIEEKELIAWLVEAFLKASANGSGAIVDILNSPSIFPFQLDPIPPQQLSSSPRLDVLRHGLDDHLVMLKKAY